jgi:pimeloyl-ACP methyl ester carboxylesterase
VRKAIAKNGDKVAENHASQKKYEKDEMMLKTEMKRRRIKSGDAMLAVSEIGQGQQLIFLNGLGATQGIWKKVMRRLSGQYQLVTFDFRGHGRSTVANDNSLESFFADAEAVIGAVGKGRPILVGHSLGADLAVWYTAAHPGAVAGTFLIDGALPVKFIDDADELKRQFNNPVWRIIFALTGILKFVGILYRFSPDDFATIAIQLDARHQQGLGVYEKLDCPIELVLATKSAGKRGEKAQKMNASWRAGAEQLASKYPSFSIHWLDSTHLLPLTKPAELAEALDDFVRRVKADDQFRAHNTL